VDKIRKRVSKRDLPGVEVLFALRGAARQMDNAVNEWMAGSAGSLARYQILMALRATKGTDISHKDIVEAMGVTRATVSGLMAALEREGLVESAVDSDDRRKLIARLTAKGEIVVEEAFGVAMARFGKLFAPFSREELTTLTALLNRVREEFVPPS
jgi:DNA-binding MarR family transcriptional regulator